MANYMADLESLQDASHDMRGLTAQMTEALAHLDAMKVAFTDANMGAAIDAYDDAQREWNKGLQMMNHALNAHAVAVLRSAELYQEADSGAATRIAQR